MSSSSSEIEDQTVTETKERRKRAVRSAKTSKDEVESKRQRTSEQEYYPCQDPLRPICRQFVNRKQCSRGLKCRFYHPPQITKAIKKQARREPGFCYCGAVQRTFLNKRAYHMGESVDIPTFFVVCARTGKSMRKCM